MTGPRGVAEQCTAVLSLSVARLACDVGMKQARTKVDGEGRGQNRNKDYHGVLLSYVLLGAIVG